MGTTVRVNPNPKLLQIDGYKAVTGIFSRGVTLSLSAIGAKIDGAEGGGVCGGGITLPGGEGSGEGAVPPPQKIFVILHFKWCIFMQFGVGA